jgi:quercetin dioxygenase-like cupin family protein
MGASPPIPSLRGDSLKGKKMIKIEKPCKPASFKENKVVVQKLLEGEIAGLDSFYICIENGADREFIAQPARQRVLLIVSGSGRLDCRGMAFQFNGTTVFAHGARDSFLLYAASDTECLELLYDLAADEAKEDCVQHGNLPFFLPYSQCNTYREAIKSEKTVNRTMLREETVPRFCMGSVQTEGPDEVGAHAHPMLEQLFFGLESNDCIVTADGEEAKFGEGTLLHIPVGSMHGAHVPDSHRLHYVWMDLFFGSDMSYIGATHITQE